MRCPACGSDTGTGAPRCARCNAPLPAPVAEHVTILDPEADAALTRTTESGPPPARPVRPARSATGGGRARGLLLGPAGWVVAGVLAVALAGAMMALWPRGDTARPAGTARPTGSPDGTGASGEPVGPQASASPSALATVGERFWVDTFQEAEGFTRPDSSSGVIGVLDAGRNWVLCRRKGSREQRTDAQGRVHRNHWWLLTGIDRFYGDGGTNPRAWVSALYLSRWGDDEAKDDEGRDIPQCPPGDMRTTG
ncbi:hypothetical protein ACQEU3_34925 [Spirillospora sp. CA-253888]